MSTTDAIADRPFRMCGPDRFLATWDRCHRDAVVGIESVAPEVAALVMPPEAEDRSPARVAAVIATYFGNAGCSSGRKLWVLGRGAGGGGAVRGFALRAQHMRYRPAPKDPKMRPWFDRMEALSRELEASPDFQHSATSPAELSQAARRTALKQVIVELASEENLDPYSAELRLAAAGISWE